MQFEVNGQVYFLSFIESEGAWSLLAPTLTGVRRIPVYVDTVKYGSIDFATGIEPKISG